MLMASCTAQVAPAAEGGGSGLYGVRNSDAAFGLVQQFATAMSACALPYYFVLPMCNLEIKRRREERTDYLQCSAGSHVSCMYNSTACSVELSL